MTRSLVKNRKASDSTSAPKRTPKAKGNPELGMGARVASDVRLDAPKGVGRDRLYRITAHTYVDGQLLECSDSFTLAGAFGVLYDDLGEAKGVARDLHLLSPTITKEDMVYLVTNLRGDIVYEADWGSGTLLSAEPRLLKK